MAAKRASRRSRRMSQSGGFAGWPRRVLRAASARSCRSSQSRSAAGSHAASRGPSGRNHSTATARNTAGRPSRMNSHCQPARPSPVTLSSAPEIGEPRNDEIGIEIMKIPMIRAR